MRRITILLSLAALALLAVLSLGRQHVSRS